MFPITEEPVYHACIIWIGVLFVFKGLTDRFEHGSLTEHVMASGSERTPAPHIANVVSALTRAEVIPWEWRARVTSARGATTRGSVWMLNIYNCLTSCSIRSFVMIMRKKKKLCDSRKLNAIKPTIRALKSFWCSRGSDQTHVLKRGVKHHFCKETVRVAQFF